jgi:hypothetical protein
MKWIKSNEQEPLNEGKYFCKDNNVKLILEFVKIKPKRERFTINEHFDESMLDEIIFWTEDINSSTHIKSHEELVWLDEN